MGAIADRLAALGLTLPAPAAAPPGVRLPFAPVRVHGDVAYVSGHGPFDGPRQLYKGSVGGEVSVDEGYAAARATALAVTPAAINGFSDLILELRGEAGGRHARSAIGAGELPFGMPVEVEAVVALG